MILTGNQIKQENKKGNITIEPFNKKLVNPNSYNYRLAPEILKLKKGQSLDSAKRAKFEKVIIDDEDGYKLMPGNLYLARTFEQIGSNKYTTILLGRSSVGRLGLFLQITADLGHVGTLHCWTLELKVVQPLRIYPHMKIGQVSFWVNKGDPKELYNGFYKQFSRPYPSSFYKEFNT